MSNTFSIDTHKLSQHPKRVSEWLDGHKDWNDAKKIYPIYMEISPVGACNHRCTFCSVDYIGYKTRYLPFEPLLKNISEMAKNGVKSLMFAGEGEPALYKKLPEVLDHCSSVGIDSSLTTNMVPFTKKNVESFVRNCKWIKTSINAGSAEAYGKIHQTKEKDFYRVLDNFSLSIDTRNRNNYECTIGGQILLLPDNAETVVDLANELKNRGVDYLVVKPYTQSLYGNSTLYKGLKYGQFDSLEQELKEIETSEFRIIYRKNAMQKLHEKDRAYPVCNATPFFWAYVMANGDLYACSAYLQDERFCIGNINETSFQQLWEGNKRKEIFEFVAKELDISKCRVNCRMDSVNRYLWSLENPDSHVNFI